MRRFLAYAVLALGSCQGTGEPNGRAVALNMRRTAIVVEMAGQELRLAEKNMAAIAADVAVEQLELMASFLETGEAPDGFSVDSSLAIMDEAVNLIDHDGARIALRAAIAAVQIYRM